MSFRILTVLFAGSLLVSCTKDIDTQPTYDAVDSTLKLAIVDENGNDLLAPTTNSPINPAKIRIQYIDRGQNLITLENGALVYKASEKFPIQGFYVCHINVGQNIWRTAKNEVTSNILIKWNEQQTYDTIDCRFRFENNWRQLIEIKINSTKWQVENATRANFKMVLKDQQKTITLL